MLQSPDEFVKAYFMASYSQDCDLFEDTEVNEQNRIIAESWKSMAVGALNLEATLSGDVFSPVMKDIIPASDSEEECFDLLGPSTQQIILAEWKSEYETPVTKRTATLSQVELGSPILFQPLPPPHEEHVDIDDNYLEDISTQFFKMTQFSNLPRSESNGSPQKSRNDSLIGVPTPPSIGKKRLSGFSDLPLNIKDLFSDETDIAEPQRTPTKSRSISPLDLNNVKTGDIEMAVVGFATASGKKIKTPSKAAKARAEQILSSVSCDKEDVTKIESCEAPNPPTFVGFQTASKKAIAPPSKAAQEKANRILEAVKDDFHTGEEPRTMFFTSASGKVIAPPSKAAMERAQTLIDDHYSELQPGSKMLFQSASGKPIAPPSRAAMERAQKLVKEQEPDQPFDGKMLFQSASGKSLKMPDKEAIVKAQKILALAESPVSGITSRLGQSHIKAETSPLNPAATRRNSLRPLSKRPMHTGGMPNSNRNTSTKQLSTHDWRSLIKRRTKSDPAYDDPSTPISSTAGMVASSPLAKTPSKVFMIDTSSLGRRLQLNSVNINRDMAAVSIDFGYSIQDLFDLFPIVSEAWIENHAYFIVWKLLAYRQFGIDRIHESLKLNINNLRSQLSYRYEREVNLAQRSILKRICEQDEGAAGFLVLFVSAIDKITLQIDVSDGWYSLPAVFDPTMKRLVQAGRIRIGMKVKISLSSLVATEACEMLEAKSRNVQLKIHGNSCRPAKWHTKLGKQPKSTFVVSLNSIDMDGGIVSAVEVVVLRKYPLVYNIEYDSGKRESLSKDKFELLSNSMAEVADETDRVASVRLCCKVLVGEYCGREGLTKMATITFWEANPELAEKLVYGAHIKVVALKPTIVKETSVSLSSTKLTRIVFASPTAQVSGRPIPSDPKPLSIPQIDALVAQSECDIAGRKIAVSDGHLWIVTGDESFLKLIVIKFPPGIRIPPGAASKESCSILAWDVSFLYTDPKYGFPVFLFTDQSQFWINNQSHPMIPDSETCKYGLSQATEYVNNLLKTISS